MNCDFLDFEKVFNKQTMILKQNLESTFKHYFCFLFNSTVNYINASTVILSQAANAYFFF